MKEPETTVILVVDDEASVARVVSRWLSAEGYECEQASGGREALEALRRREFALVVTDIMMPGMSGIELLEQVRNAFPETAVFMLTAVDDRKTATTALELGAYGYMIKPVEQNELLISVTNVLERRRLTLLSKRYESELEEKVSEQTEELRTSREDISLRLMAAQQYRHDETGAHIRRLGLYAEAMARQMDKSIAESEMLRLAAPMHDVGKIGVPDAILLKPGKLTDEEFDTMKSHTTIGGRIMEGSKVPLVNVSRDIALSHHEKWDDSGYPQGLSGEDIPEFASIEAVLDVYDALSHDRVYRPAMPEEETLAVIAGARGAHFEPRLVDTFMDTLPELRRIRAEVKDEQQVS